MANAKKILECSSKGDKRFSAMYAQVKAFGVTDTIENHYQKCKRTGTSATKGQPVDHIVLIRRKFPATMLTAWYRMLWIRYLDNNPDLVEYARQFDEFTDMFRGKNTINCQADVIRDYITDREQLLRSVSGLSEELRQIHERVKNTRQCVNDLIAAFTDGSLRLEELNGVLVSKLISFLDGSRQKELEEERLWQENFHST